LNSSTKEMYTLKVALSPEDAQTTLTFKSSNPSVASVNSAGRIVARGEGTATIKVISTNGKVATCTVQVS
ncbi:MAG: Ig-like domain-containing protein, partial [Clostridia bacterium]|nr:Ig-like domain-containing protein [Clostridia bacterium]